MVVVALDHHGLVHHLLHVGQTLLLVDAPRVLALVHVVSVAEFRLRLMAVGVERDRLVHFGEGLLLRHRQLHDAVD